MAEIGNELGIVDPSSFSRPDLCAVRKLHLSWDINFTEKIISGEVDLRCTKIDENATELILDCMDLNILSVQDDNDEILTFTISEKVGTFGSKLTVKLRENMTDKLFSIKIKYKTSPSASGLQWLEPIQTMSKEKPFLFSQFQAVHARSAVPCQDTPFVKATYTADITGPDGITILMSATRVDKPESLPDGRKKYKFEQKVPIPSYLIAIAAGKLESRELGPRSHVWAEPGLIEAAAFEFTETEQMLKTGEKICGPYVWGIYDLLVLPPSFPFGGMENPCLTFVTPTIIAGDRSLASVVAHEITHSWTGNLVTNKNFEHFWLNEGFTVFVERKIIGRMQGPQVQDFAALNGANTLQETISKMGENNPLTKLVLDLKGVHPDDSFSSVPYEKGHIFLRYLEEIVGGPAKFEPFLRNYITDYKFKSVETNDFKNDFLKYFADTTEINTIDWNLWLFGTGMPPIIPDYDKTLANACVILKDKWLSWTCSCSKSTFSPNDLEKMTSNQIIYFLQLLLDSAPQSINKLQNMDEMYKLSTYSNSEIRFRWIRIGLKAQWKTKVEDALKMVQDVGRMKFVRPLYQDMYKWEEIRPRAIEVYKKNKDNMMFVSAYTVKQDLHLDD